MRRVLGGSRRTDPLVSWLTPQAAPVYVPGVYVPEALSPVILPVAGSWRHRR